MPGAGLRSVLRRADAGLVLGVEQEYRLASGARKVDFREIVHELGLGQRRLDPSDANAYRLPSGAKLTCDEEEAEIALPPVPVGPGFARRAAEMVAVERSDLLRRLPRGTRLEGHSTHVSVAVADSMVVRVARLYMEHFAVAHALVSDGSHRPGVAIRPRYGRVELCGEFVEGGALERSCLFAVAGVLACVRAAAGRRARRGLPPAVAVTPRPVVQRSGWYVDGVDDAALRRLGRRAPVRLAGAREATAGQLLGASWRSARDGMVWRVGEDDLGPLDAIVEGTAPLPFEHPDEVTDRPSTRTQRPTAFGDLLAPRRRSGFALAPVMVTWETTVFMAIDRSGRRVFVCIPAGWLDSFLTTLDAGGLDASLARCLESRRHGHLGRRSQTRRPGVYGSMCARAHLLPRERVAA